MRREELALVNLLENLSEDEKARLNEDIKLIPKYNDQLVPYKKEDGMIEEQAPEFIVPRKIRLMSGYISKILKESP